MNVRKKIAIAGVLYLFASGLLAADDGAASTSPRRASVVRQLKYVSTNPMAAMMLGGQGKVTIAIDVAVLEKLVGGKDAKKLADQVDFSKEKVVLVSWTTGGPPEGTLKSELIGTGDDRRIVFYVQAPAGVVARGMRARIGADFFAVPRKSAVSFEAAERP